MLDRKGTMEQEKIRDILRRLGCSHVSFNDDTDVDFDFNDRTYNMKVEDIVPELNSLYILTHATWFTCCGDEMVGDDSDLCPTCKEHC